MSVVLFQLGFANPLLLQNVRFDSSGKVEAGYVENGCWHYKRDGDKCMACNHIGRILHSWASDPNERFVAVPDSMLGGGYNEIIEWAKTQCQGKP